jgi:hypothetical protein
MRRDGQNAERLGQDEEHRCRDPLASPLPAVSIGRKSAPQPYPRSWPRTSSRAPDPRIFRPPMMAVGLQFR